MEIIKTLTDKDVTGKSPEEPKTYSLREAGRAIVFNKEGKIALLHAFKYCFHKLPGGGVEQGEDVKKALERELLEEIGCKIKIIKELGIILEIKNEYCQKQTSYCYIAEVIELGKNKLTEEESEDLGIGVEWVTLKKAIRLMKKDNPDDYTGKFILARDLCFLEEANKMKRNS